MDRRKIILLGGPGVGKTSLVARWTKGIFSERYLSTIGVKIEKKVIWLGGREVVLQIWDLAGENELRGTALDYIRGASGCLLVVDGTRKETLDLALGLARQVTLRLGEIPLALALNKADLSGESALSGERLAELGQLGMVMFKTSAKSGDGVEEAFADLAQRALERGDERAVS